MDEKLMDRFIKNKIDSEEELVISNSVNIKLDKIYQDIRKDNIPIKHEKKKFRKMAVIAILVLGIFATAAMNPVLADNIPGLNQLSKYLRSIYSFNDNYILNADKINITQKDKGIEINLEGVIYDDSSLKFIYTLTTDKKLQWGVQLRKNTLKINGKNIEGNSKRIKSEDEKMSDDNDELEKYAVITTFDISDLRLEDKVNIDWAINEIHTWDGNYENGNWEFKFNTSKEILKAKSKIVNDVYSFEEEGYKFSIDKIIFTPIEIKMIATEDARLLKDLGDARVEYEKNPTDNEMKERISKLEKIDHEMDLFSMNVMDEKGNTLIPTHGRGKDGAMVYLYKPLAEIPDKLIFTPTNCMAEKEDDSMYCPNEEQYISLKDINTPFEYVQGKNMSVVINSIENKDGKTRMNVTFKGDFIASRVAWPFEVLPDGIKYPTKAEEKNKFYDLLESLNVTSPKERSKYKEEANNTNRTFNYEYELKQNEEYNLVFSKIQDDYYRKNKQFSIKIN